MKIDFVGPGYKGRSTAVNSQEMVNFYPEITTAGKSQIVLIPTPGTIIFTTITEGGTVRKLHTSSTGRFFAIVGNNFIEVFEDKTYTVIAQLDTNEGYVSTAENAFQLMISDASGGYIYWLNPGTTTTLFQKINIDGYEAGSHVICNNGFFIQNKIGSAEFIFSQFQNGLVWNPLWYYNAEGSADIIKAIATVNNEIWTFGTRATTVWFCTGGSSTDPNDLFARVQSAYFNIGCEAAASVATINNIAFWLGADAEGANIVWMANGYQPIRVSTNSIEFLIGHMGETTEDAYGYCYQQEGHSFYVLTFPKGNKTIVYDLTTGFWHERGWYNKDTGNNDAHKGYSYTFWNHKNLLGDRTSGNIYILDLDTYADEVITRNLATGIGTSSPPASNTSYTLIKRIRTGGHIQHDRKRLYFTEFEIDLQRGIGTNVMTGLQDATKIVSNEIVCPNPQANLQWSDDGGFTWSNGYWASPGRIGEHNFSLSWHRLGMSRDRVFRLTVTDPVKWIIIGARADIDLGDN